VRDAVVAAGGPAHVTVVCVDVPGCEGGAILVTAADGRLVERSGKDLHRVSTIVASGDAIRHGKDAEAVVKKSLSTHEGWQPPEAPNVVVDEQALLSSPGCCGRTHWLPSNCSCSGGGVQVR
jgi:hypothetical protein